MGVFCYFKSPPPSSEWPAAAPSWLCASVTAYIIFARSDPFGYVRVLPPTYYMCSVLPPVAMWGYYFLAIICVRSWKPGTQVVPGTFWVIHRFWKCSFLAFQRCVTHGNLIIFEEGVAIWMSSQKLKGRKSLSKRFTVFTSLSWCSFASHLDKPSPLSRTVSGLAGQKVVWTMVIKSSH